MADEASAAWRQPVENPLTQFPAQVITIRRYGPCAHPRAPTRLWRRPDAHTATAAHRRRGPCAHPCTPARLWRRLDAHAAHWCRNYRDPTLIITERWGGGGRDRAFPPRGPRRHRACRAPRFRIRKACFVLPDTDAPRLDSEHFSIGVGIQKRLSAHVRLEISRKAPMAHDQHGRAPDGKIYDDMPIGPRLATTANGPVHPHAFTTTGPSGSRPCAREDDDPVGSGGDFRHRPATRHGPEGLRGLRRHVEGHQSADEAQRHGGLGQGNCMIHETSPLLAIATGMGTLCTLCREYLLNRIFRGCSCFERTLGIFGVPRQSRAALLRLRR